MINETQRLKEIIDIIKKHHLFKDESPTNIRIAIEELGPTFIKLGQIMSSRNDLIPNEYCVELKKLRSSVKPMSFNLVEKILNEQYDNKTYEIYKSIEKNPIGSASIAQTHKAKLKTGEDVVIKVQRENIYEMMTLDAKLIKKAIHILQIDKLFGNIINLDSLINEMYETAKEEMDFNIELKHMNEFYVNNRDVVYLKSIKTYPQYSTQYVLVMEYIGGTNIDDVKTLKANGYDMKEISLKLAQNYIKQAIDDGFYHADPHADNIKIEDGKIVFLDFGMMGRLSNQNKKLLNGCIKAIVQNDIKEIDHILCLMNTSNYNIDHMRLCNDISKILDKNKTTGVANIDVKDFISDMYELLNSNNILLPQDVTVLIRGIVVIAGLLEEISPEISLIDVLKDRFTISTVLNESELKNIISQGVTNGVDLVNIPNELLMALKGINTGELRFNIEMNDSKLQSIHLDTIIHQFIIAIVDVSFIIGISIMASNSKFSLVFYFYCLISLLCTMWLLLKMKKSKKRRK